MVTNPIKKIFFNLWLICLAIFLMLPLSKVNANESQHWNDLLLRIKHTPRVELELYNRSRWREIPFNETYQNCIQPGIRYKFSSRLNMLAAYRYDALDRGDYYEFENRFLVQFVCSLPSIMTIAPRISQRTELRYFSRASEDHVRLRLRFDLSRNFVMYKRKITPMLSYELFWDDIADDFNRQRIYLGASMPLTGHLTIRLTWIKQLDKNRDDTNILNTGINLSF